MPLSTRLRSAAIVEFVNYLAAAAKSSYQAGWDASHAINGIVSGDVGWVAAAGDIPNWWQLQLTTPVMATSYSITNRNDVYQDRYPRTWTFSGSNDGTTWTTLDTRTLITFTSGQVQTFYFTNTVPYTYYRLNITADNGSAYLSFVAFHLYGRP